MKFVLSYLSEYKKETILAPLFKMLEAIFELLVPLVVASIINKGILQGDESYLLKMSGVLIVLAVVGVVTAITAQYFAAKAAIYSASKMRRDLYVHIGKFSDATLNQFGDAKLITRLTNDINQVQNGINMVLRLLLRSPFIVFGAFVMACIVDAKASIIFIVVIGVLALIIYAIMKSTLPRYKRIQKALEKLFTRVNENISGVRVIRGFRQEEKEYAQFVTDAEDLYGQQISTGRISVLLNPLTYVAVNLGVVALLYYSGIEVNMGRLNQGEVVALTNYMSQILVELLKFANTILLLTRAFASVDRLEEIMHSKPDERITGRREQGRDHTTRVSGSGRGSMGGALRESGSYLQALNVNFSYPDGQETVVENISFELKKGDFFTIIGGTGSGKSSLMNLLVHAYDCTAGEVRINGKNVNEYSDAELARLIGVVPQRAELFAGTVESNLKMAKEDASEDEMWEALGAAQIADVIKEKGGLSTKVSRCGNNFSGGQKQRLTIARALVKKPEILILDDSASALDLGTERRLRDTLKSLSWNPTILFVSQRASSCIDADGVLVLEDGRAVGLGTHEQLLESCEVYQEIYYCQFPARAGE
jgi:ABC-type multidrug transport system fused ATPase/permease subunit